MLGSFAFEVTLLLSQLMLFQLMLLLGVSGVSTILW